MRNGGIDGRFLLMFDKDDEALWADAVKQFSQSLSNIVELRWNHRPGMRLVRPDGYAAFASSTVNETTLASLRAVLEQQTR